MADASAPALPLPRQVVPPYPRPASFFSLTPRRAQPGSVSHAGLISSPGPSPGVLVLMLKMFLLGQDIGLQVV